ncbi:MAG TPA: serine hydrolase domain-containing protein [Candidatus Binataceae bacterium]|nr:serine hydrolase domain-containing protein [Candidatus Binataceae bacterium]
MKTAKPAEVGLDATRLERLSAAIKDDIAKEKYDGAVFVVARDGKVAMHEAIGFAERSSGRVARTDDVFFIFSITKALTAAAVLTRIDRGELSLTTRIADVIPEFAGKGKARVTIAQLMSHTGGLGAGLPPIPPELIGNQEAMIAAICQMGVEAVPGEKVAYSAIIAHAVLAEVVRRIDGGSRRFRDILAGDLLEPLGMKDTALGMRKDLAPRKVPVVVRDRSDGLFPPEMLEAFNMIVQEDSEVPGAGAFSTASDLFRFAEALRRGGELDGVRILSPAIIRLATTVHTGTRRNSLWDYALEMRGWDEFPAFIGLTFFLRGSGIFPHWFGNLNSPGTFGSIGAGSTMFWVDPERALTFVCLTAGLLEETRSVDRFQRLSDLVSSAVVS